MKEDRAQTDRRSFLSKVGVAGAATIAAGVVGVEPLFKTERSSAQAAPAQSGNQRANDCAKIRRDAAQNGKEATPANLQHPSNPSNDDENLYPNKLGNYSKGLPHNNDGTVVLAAYDAFLNAINSGDPADFDAIPLGGGRKLTNPQSGLAFDIEGPDFTRTRAATSSSFRQRPTSS